MNEIVEALGRVDVEILMSFANNGMKVSATARETFYDRRTIEYRLDRIRKAVGLNPRDFWDLHTIIGAIKAESERSDATCQRQ